MTLAEFAIVTRFAELAGTDVENLSISHLMIIGKSPHCAMRAFQEEASKYCAVLNVRRTEIEVAEQMGEVDVMRSFTRITGTAVSTR